MVRFFARTLGFVLIAAGFVSFVIDGTRSIANSAVSFTPLGQLAHWMLRDRFLSIEPGVTRVHPWLWDPLLLNVFLLPASVLAVGLGALLVWLGQRPAEPIGFLAGR